MSQASMDQLFELRYAPGPTWRSELGMAEQDLGAHVSYMKELGKGGDLLTAAPYADESGGLALLWAAGTEAARAVVAADPAVMAGTMECEVRRVVPRAGAVDSRWAGQRHNEALVLSLFAAVAARDPSALTRYGASVVIHEAQSLPYGGEYSGLEGVVQHARAYLQSWDSVQGADEREFRPTVFSHGDQVVVLYRQRGKRSAPPCSLDMPAMAIYRLADGKIIESRMFHFDSAAIASFLGGTPSEVDAGPAIDEPLANG